MSIDSIYLAMRERITFVHGAEEAFDPEQLRLDNDTLQVKSLKAAQEDRLTFSFHELPQEVLSDNEQQLFELITDSDSYGES